ncbi:cobyric acid synthase [Acidovorax sp. FJL06]|uniref:cobyric acid synthase n=1 Tax=Acidovorax sp. FJL06 TaxID=2153365 RepID=UPI000F56AAA5|nr:cobyric acid synthase [Acidovorax sp. FJL06]RQO82393.1 cobyric acid synthase CobQ [Acidovorax sp. FJL06]
MVLGTTSGAGKSWLTTALCRHYSNLGLRVAPFKAQNMSNNARVVSGPGGSLGEIGSAQYFQALAARAEPEVRMNPLLLKPEADTHSQVVLMGQVSAELTAMPWRGRSEKVWPQIAAALDALRAENDVVVIEGAGSPAEINLHASDIVNMRVARHADARCLLVTDIDRGGAFAHLYGTWALLPEEERALIHGFVLNKFRGDASLLAPAPQMLHQLAGVPTVATIPMQWRHGLPEEDGVFDDRSTAAGAVHTTVAVVAYPRISNLDEFQPLKNVPGVRLLWVRSPADIGGLKPTDWVVLPGSKSTAADLAWLRAQGLDQAIAHHAGRGGTVLGVCGGLQMLGEALIDTAGIDGNAPGLGLLPLVTTFEVAKTVQRTQAQFGAVRGAWAALADVSVMGYEIHHGQTAQHPAMAAKGDVAREVIPGIAWQNPAGNVLGVYLHGLFEDAAVLHALFGAQVPTLDSVFDGLAGFLGTSFTPGVLDALVAQ